MSETQDETIVRLEARVKDLEGALAARTKEVQELHIRRGLELLDVRAG